MKTAVITVIVVAVIAVAWMMYCIIRAGDVYDPGEDAEQEEYLRRYAEGRHRDDGNRDG